MPTTYTPQPLWLLVGPLIGAAVGALAAVGLMLTMTVAGAATSGDSWAAVGQVPVVVVAGLAMGGALGAVAGFFAGLPLIFLVGRHLPRPVARRRALVVGTLGSPLAVVTMLAVVSGDASVLPSGLPTADDWGVVVVLLVPSLVGGLIAAWAAGRDALPKPVS